MKKSLAFLLSLSLLFCSCSAAAETSTPVQEEPAAIEAPVAPTSDKTDESEMVITYPDGEEPEPITIQNGRIVPASEVTSTYEAPAYEAPQTITVYVTRTGKKYHSAGCRYLRKSCIPMDLEDAQYSYSPCSKCNPPL